MAYVGSGDITRKDIEQLTHINLAFGGIDSEGNVYPAENRKICMAAEWKQWNPDIKIILSIVGKDPRAFSRCCSHAELRRKAAVNLSQAVSRYQLDGIDLDWEYPCVPSNGSEVSVSDRENYTLLIGEIRRELDKLSHKHHILSIAAGADVYYIHCVELDKLIHYLDYICVMTYDLKCGFHALAGHHTPLFSNRGDVFRNSCDQALGLFCSAGVPKEKLLMGAAFYSRKWTGLEDRNHGLLQICKTGGGYGPDYDVLASDYVNKNGFIRYWDEEAKAPYLFNGNIFLSYDDEESLCHKADYVKEHGYGGIFYWEHKCDKTRKLLNTLYGRLVK